LAEVLNLGYFWKIGAALARCEKGLSGAAQAAF
jgi:hypothetical protein